MTQSISDSQDGSRIEFHCAANNLNRDMGPSLPLKKEVHRDTFLYVRLGPGAFLFREFLRSDGSDRDEVYFSDGRYKGYWRGG